MIDAPLDNEPQITLYYPDLAVDAILHHGACCRCRRAGILVAQMEIRYPGTIRRFECCQGCRSAIANVLDSALVEAGV